MERVLLTKSQNKKVPHLIHIPDVMYYKNNQSPFLYMIYKSGRESFKGHFMRKKIQKYAFAFFKFMKQHMN